MLPLYRQYLTSEAMRAEESQNYYQPITELHLQILWLEQKFMCGLTTVQGKKVQVLSPGIWNKEAGPDFLKAHLKIGDQEYRGDIEIHLHEEGWYQHGHHLDSRYNQVIWHLSLWSSKRQLTIQKENGQQAFASYLGENIEILLKEWIKSIDLDLYPNKQWIGKGECSQKLFCSLPKKEIDNFFQSAAFWRLERKLTFLEKYFESDHLQFAMGIAMALGFKHNATAFAELFVYLLPFRDLPHDELLAIALGCCGFLEENRKQKWKESEYYQSLSLLWRAKCSEITHQVSLKLDRIRPLHHPIRRLVYLVYLLRDHQLESLWTIAEDIWNIHLLKPDKSLNQLKNNLLEILPHYSDSYWDCHYTFEKEAQNRLLPGLGEDLKTHILLNTYLPLIYGSIRKSRNLKHWESFQHFYASIKTTHTSKSLYLHQRFFGEHQPNTLFKEALMVQGAYQLHQDFCVHFESSCKGCPFVERYKIQHHLI